MKFHLKTSQITKQSSDCLIIGVFTNNSLTGNAKQIDEASQNIISKMKQQGDLAAPVGSVLLLHNPPSIKSKRILLVSLGKQEEFTDKQFTKACLAALTAINKNSVKTAHITLCELAVQNRDLHWKIRQIVLITNAILYQFNAFKSKKSDTKTLFQELIITVNDEKAIQHNKTAIKEGVAISEGMSLAKDLGNTPANICTPSYLANEAKKLALKNKKITFKVLDEAAMKKIGMNSLLAVSLGSSQPAKFIILNYKGASLQKKPIVLVGKGITFDTGGLSLKPPASMMGMKYDMMGAATVLGVIKACHLLNLPLNIVGLIAASENCPGNNAIKPGDIVKSLSGQTVEINNTDAEGRLVLSDALTYSERFNPDIVIDIATLTGAVVVALGSYFTGVFSPDDNLRHSLVQAGNDISDLAWPMPLHENYDEELKSDCADMSNIGSTPYGGASIAAQFLARYTKKLHWAHLDIAGSAMPSGSPKLATGRPIPLLIQFLLNYKTR